MNKCDDCKHFKGLKPWKPCNQKGWKVLKNEGVRDKDNILKLNWEGFNTLITNDFVKHLTSQNEFLIKSNRNLKERIELLENEVCIFEHHIAELESRGVE